MNFQQATFLLKFLFYASILQHITCSTQEIMYSVDKHCDQVYARNIRKYETELNDSFKESDLLRKDLEFKNRIIDKLRSERDHLTKTQEFIITRLEKEVTRLKEIPSDNRNNEKVSEPKSRSPKKQTGRHRPAK